MAVTIIGNVKFNRAVEGVYQNGNRKGEKWEFLSLDIGDTMTSFVWSCQLPSEDPSYTGTPDNSLRGHKVKAKITSQTAGERTLPNGSTRMQIRSQISALEDLGMPVDEE